MTQLKIVEARLTLALYGPPDLISATATRDQYINFPWSSDLSFLRQCVGYGRRACLPRATTAVKEEWFDMGDHLLPRPLTERSVAEKYAIPRLPGRDCSRICGSAAPMRWSTRVRPMSPCWGRFSGR